MRWKEVRKAVLEKEEGVVAKKHSAAYSRDNDPFEIDLGRAREGA